MGRPLNRPAALLPTPLGLVCLRQQSASDAILGVGKVVLGPEAVIIYTPGHWVSPRFMVGCRRSAATRLISFRRTVRAEVRLRSIPGLAHRPRLKSEDASHPSPSVTWRGPEPRRLKYDRTRWMSLPMD